MSRSFHPVHGFMHTALRDASSDREVTGEPVADAIRGFFVALAPIEYAVAGHQEGDTDAKPLARVCQDSKATLFEAMDVLRRTVEHSSAIPYAPDMR